MNHAMEDNRILRDIREFYNQFPFPGYGPEEYYSINGLYERASSYVRAIDDEIPNRARVLDMGCGTGQFAALLSVRGREVIGIDLSSNSVRKANELKQRLELEHVTFLERNIFDLDLPVESFDYVFCNGVLHHTHDPAGGFQIVARHAKPGGYVVVGLYNTYGRLMLNIRKLMFRLSKATIDSVVARLDFFLRKKELSEIQRRIWFEDQYHNPHETTHTVTEVLRWFERNNLDFVAGIPNPQLYGKGATSHGYFGQPVRPPSQLEAQLAQLGWIFSTEHEGGYFLMIGRKRDTI